MQKGSEVVAKTRGRRDKRHREASQGLDLRFLLSEGDVLLFLVSGCVTGRVAGHVVRCVSVCLCCWLLVVDCVCLVLIFPRFVSLTDLFVDSNQTDATKPKKRFVR